MMEEMADHWVEYYRVKTNMNIAFITEMGFSEGKIPNTHPKYAY
jgi:hypothetical protein